MKILSTAISYVESAFTYLHRWKYKNPYERTCTVCGRTEVQYCEGIEDFHNSSKGWWETHNEGNQNLHKGWVL